jgi:hypothetical protein
MKSILIASFAVLALSALTPEAHGAACGAGRYRAGCVGPNGAVVAGRPAYRPPVHGGQVTCARGPYRAGCAGPNGAVVRRY